MKHTELWGPIQKDLGSVLGYLLYEKGMNEEEEKEERRKEGKRKGGKIREERKLH